MNASPLRDLRTGLWAALFLAGPILLTFLIAFGIQALPFHIDIADAAPVFFVIFFGLCAGGRWLWGGRLAADTSASEPRRMSWAGAISYAPMVIAAVLGLGALERIFVEQRASDLPIHVLFAILFTGGTLIVCAVLGVALGIALRSGAVMWKLALGGGVSGALGFLLITLILDLLGRRVGGPNAAATATMLTTMWAGNIVGAFTSGAASACLIRRNAATASSA